MITRQPVVHIIAGPNGAGKTTFALEFLPRFAHCRNFVNADLIARGLSPLDVDATAIQAGRLFLMQIRRQMLAKNDFAFETTLSGLTYLRLIHDLRKKGYSIRLCYLWIPTTDLMLKRIAERVQRGGHNVPSAVAMRRYGKGLLNLFHHYIPLVDYSAIFDNTSTSPVLVYERSRHAEHIVKPDILSRIRRRMEDLQ